MSFDSRKYVGCDEQELVGKTVLWVESDQVNYVKFVTENDTYAIFHYQDCCESVSIDSINMSFDSENMCEINDVVGAVISESNSRETCSGNSTTRTRYVINFNSDNWLSIIWEGESNGYYSETPQFYKKENRA